MEYRHKEYGMGFKAKRAGYGTSIVEMVLQAQRCMGHAIDYIMNNHTYRKYRRGKNRCLRCGVKLWKE